ncbi:SET domain-containing protein-lysine N-methyltransferase [Streptomyces sp. NPDC005077]|uniref:SET domain-containing protein-lysine N-methyltransferase n=1 Tax=Streptomyces sp. NPDC005077 TaxID=3154292 RepID=UPI0033A96422
MMDDGFELRGTHEKGEGVFATRPFRIDEAVMVGVIDRELDRNHSHASQVGAERFVLHGGLVPKVNHSCEPNCGIRLNSSGAHDFVARAPITAGEEITFDYAMRNYSVDYFAARCRCGARHCRGRITGWRDLPTRRKADYHGFVAPYLIEIDHRARTALAARRDGGSRRGRRTTTDMTGRASELP